MTHPLTASLISRRVKVGAESPEGRRLSTLACLVDVEPVDAAHDRRKKAILNRTVREIEQIRANHIKKGAV